MTKAVVSHSYNPVVKARVLLLFFQITMSAYDKEFIYYFLGELSDIINMSQYKLCWF